MIAKYLQATDIAFQHFGEIVFQGIPTVIHGIRPYRV